MSVQASQLVAEVKVTGDEEAKAKLKSVGATNDSVGSKIKTALGGAAVIATGAAIAAGVASLKMAGDFNSATTTLVTGAGESQKNLEMVRQGILSIGPATGETTKELTDGMFMIESAGQHGKQALDTLTAAAEGAKVGGADLASVANGVTTEMTDYASSNLTAAQATNDLIATVANGKTHMQDLATSMSSILPTSAAVHVSLTDVSGAMATMTGEGTNASQAATYLRQLLLALEAPASKGATALKNIGLTAGQVATDMKQSLPATLKLITDRLAATYGEGSPKYVAALKDIAGGARNMQGMLELTDSHLSVFKDNVLKIADAVKKGGSSISGWALVQQNFNQKLDQARSIVETLGITFGEKLIPVASEGIDLFSKFATSLNDTSSPAHQLTSDIEKFGTNIFTTAEKSGAFQAVLKMVDDILPSVEQYIGHLGSAVEQLLPPTLDLIKNFSAMIDNSGWLKDALSTLGGAIQTVSSILSPLIQEASNLFNWLSQNKPATDALESAVVILGGAFLALKIGNTVAGFAQMFTKVTEGKGIIEGLSDAFGNKLGGAINDFLNIHAPKLKTALGDIGGEAKGAASEVTGLGTAAETTAGKEDLMGDSAFAADGKIAGMGKSAATSEVELAGAEGAGGGGLALAIGTVGGAAALLALPFFTASPTTKAALFPDKQNQYQAPSGFWDFITHQGAITNQNSDLSQIMSRPLKDSQTFADNIDKAWNDMESLFGDAEKRGQILGDLADPRKMDATDVKIQQIKEHLDDLGKPVEIHILTHSEVAANLKITEFKSHLDDLTKPVNVNVGIPHITDTDNKIIQLKEHLDDLAGNYNIGVQYNISGPSPFHGHASGGFSPIGEPFMFNEAGPEIGVAVPGGVKFWSNSQSKNMLGQSLLNQMPAQQNNADRPVVLVMDGHVVGRGLMPHIADQWRYNVNSRVA